MGKLNVFTLLTVVVVQFVVGYVWFGSYLFGDVMVAGGHGVDFLKLDVISMLLLVLSSYGLSHVIEKLVVLMHVKDMGGCIKLGLDLGVFVIGLPVVLLLSLLGFSKILLLVVFSYFVLISILTTIIVLKFKKV